MTVASHPSGFRRWLVASEKATNRTAKAYAGDVEAFLASTAETVLDSSTLEAKLNRFFAAENQSASTRRRMRAALGHYFSYPKVDEGVRKLGFAWLETLVDEKNRERRLIEVSDIESLIEAAASTSKDIHKVRNIALIAYMYATGSTLQMTHDSSLGAFENFDGNKVPTYEGVAFFDVDTLLKIPLHQDAQRALSHWYREQQRFPGLNQRDPYENVWCNVSLNPPPRFNGSGMSEITITKLLASLSQSAGLARPISAADIRDLTLRQLGPSLETYVLVNQDPNIADIGSPTFLHALKSRLERIEPLKNLERLLAENHWQASSQPPVFTLDHAKPLVKGALRERGTVEAARAVSLVGFLIGTGLTLAEALKIRRSQIRTGDNFIDPYIFYEGGAVPLSTLAQSALSLWIQWAGDGPYRGEKLVGDETPIWWFNSSSNSEAVAAWQVLDHASSLGGLGFTATASDLKQLFDSLLGASNKTLGQVPPLQDIDDKFSKFQLSSSLRQEVLQQLYKLSTALRESDALTTFTTWYQSKAEEKFGQLRPFESIVQSR